MRTSWKWSAGLLGLILVIGTGLVWVLGPTYGMAVAGKPVFPVPPSPQRYAGTVFDIAQRQGIYAGTPEFTRARELAEEAILDADSYADTYPHIDAVLTAAGGEHSRLLLPGQVPPERGAGDLPTVGTDGQVVTVTLPATDETWNGREYADAAAVPLVAAANNGACGVILDLRDNTGGDLGPMLAGVSPLLPDGEVLWFSTPAYDTPVTVSGGSVTGGGTATTASVGAKVGLPTAVLVNELTASSGEATMLAFRGLGNSRSFGVPTAGYASANISFEMPGGARVLLTTARDRARTGEIFSEDPIQPDHVDVAPEAAARQWLVEQGCGDPG